VTAFAGRLQDAIDLDSVRDDLIGVVHQALEPAHLSVWVSRRNLGLSALVNRLKGVSAHYLRKEFTGRVSQHLMHGHLWSPSYFAASCGGAPLPVIKEYIEQQKRPG
jgi:REP element-mobilizing transposase RayT